MRHLLISAAAAMSLVGAATIANAQAPDDKRKEPAAEGKAPASDGKARQREPGTGPGTGKVEKSQHPAANRAAEPRPDGKQSGPKAERRDERTGERSGKSAEKNQDKDRPKATQQQPKDQRRSTEAPQPRKDQPKSTDAPQPRKDQPKSATQPQQGKDRPNTTEAPKSGTDPNKSATPQQPGKDQKQVGRVKVTEQQRSGVRERLVKQGKVEKTRINVTVNIGTAIPRSARLRPLPLTIVEYAPAYRGYSYIVLEDDSICIVDSRSYVIVDVIPASSQRADRRDRAQLALSTEQMRFVFANVPKDRTADVRVRLALGAEVPRNVELLAFPGDVTDQLPELRRYRYIVADGDVVIVDPNDHAVVLVIND